MSSCNWFRAAFCAAALTLCASSLAQSWPTRFDYAGLTDEGSQVATDFHGNVFVVGRIATATHGYDFGIVSYDPSGSVRWSTSWDGSQNGDDLPTSIALDWEGNLYVAGMSYYDTTRKNDFVVLKLTNGGAKVWPLSGNAHTSPDYDFYQGAIRLADNANDGRLERPAPLRSGDCEPARRPTADGDYRSIERQMANCALYCL
jgi:hypothetical protein